VFDSTTAAGTSSGTLSVSPALPSGVTLGYTVGAFPAATAGTHTVVVNLSLSGANVGNFQLASNQINVSATITPRPITVTAGTLAVTRIFDGTTNPGTASGSATVSDTVFNAANVSVTATPGNFANANAGNTHTVTFDLTLAGADSGNFSLANTTVSINNAVITPATFTGTLPNTARTVQTGEVRTISIPISAITPTAPFGTLGTVTSDLFGFTAGPVSTAATITSGNLVITSADHPQGADLSETITVRFATQNFGNIDVTVSLTTTDTPTYALTENTGAGGTVAGTASGNFPAGEPISVTATANSGYVFTGWTVSGVTLSDTNVATLSFNMPAAAVTLSGGL
jgi:hypothetical protein